MSCYCVKEGSEGSKPATKWNLPVWRYRAAKAAATPSQREIQGEIFLALAALLPIRCLGLSTRLAAAVAPGLCTGTDPGTALPCCVHSQPASFASFSGALHSRNGEVWRCWLIRECRRIGQLFDHDVNICLQLFQGYMDMTTSTTLMLSVRWTFLLLALQMRKVASRLIPLSASRMGKT